MKNNVWTKSAYSNGNGGNNCVEVLHSWFKSSHSGPGNCLEVAFHKSSHSLGNGTCVEAGYHKASGCSAGGCVEVGSEASTHCAGGECVETAVIDDTIYVRDSKDPDGPKLAFDRDEWAAFVAGVKDGEFEFDA